MTHLYAAPLLELGDDATVTPNLVEAWEQVDETTLSLTLRDGLQFTDGTSVNAEAVRYSLQRAADPVKGASDSDWLQGVSITTPNARTVLLKFPAPNAVFLEALTMNSPGGVAAIVSPTAFERLGEEQFNQQPVSIGPFKVEKLEFDGESVFVRNEGWPFTDARGARLPYLDRVRVRVISDTAVSVAELETGGIDVDYVFLNENVPRVRSQPNLDVMVEIGALEQSIIMNFVKAPTNIKALRQAICYGLDRDEFVATFLGDLGNPGAGPLTPVNRAYDPNVPTYTYDEGKARQLLSQAGFPNGLRLGIVTYTSGVYPKIGELAQAQLRRLGIDLTVDSREATVAGQEFRDEGKYELYLGGSGVPKGDPYPYFLSRYVGALPRGAELPEIKRLLDQALRTFDVEERDKLYSEIQRLDFETATRVWLMQAPRLAAHNARVRGIRWLPAGSAIDLQHAWKEA
ncbi:MAG TPA: ABC transporter substrate-binding protein [Dehalococcoidia bacterium]